VVPHEWLFFFVGVCQGVTNVCDNVYRVVFLFIFFLFFGFVSGTSLEHLGDVVVVLAKVNCVLFFLSLVLLYACCCVHVVMPRTKLKKMG